VTPTGRKVYFLPFLVVGAMPGNLGYAFIYGLNEDVKNCTEVRFPVLTAVSVKIRSYWDIAPCSFIEVDHCFRGAYCLHHEGDAWGNFPENCCLHFQVVSI
jgi:hypothetical protein